MRGDYVDRDRDRLPTLSKLMRDGAFTRQLAPAFPSITFPSHITQVTGVPCHVAEDPLNCVALGTGLALEHFDFFKKSLVQAI